MRESTAQDIALARNILDRISYIVNDNTKFVDWKSRERKDEAFLLAKEVKGYHASDRNCPACNVKVVNILRELCDMPPILGEASQSLRERRVAVCRGVAPDGSDACEHLAWPGLNCGQCGCFVDIKAAFKRFKCPLNKWPMA
jgi:hypothetical protein